MKISFNWKRSRPTQFNFSMEPCLSEHEASALKELDLDKILNMESAERVEAFSGIVSKEKAEFVNNRLENDVIIKNLKQGLMNWINGKSDVEPKWRNEIIREISELDRALNKKELKDFERKLAELSLGIGVTKEEEQKIISLFNKIDQARLKMANGGNEDDYVVACKNLEDYKAELSKDT